MSKAFLEDFKALTQKHPSAGGWFKLAMVASLTLNIVLVASLGWQKYQERSPERQLASNISNVFNRALSGFDAGTSESRSNDPKSFEKIAIAILDRFEQQREAFEKQFNVHLGAFQKQFKDFERRLDYRSTIAAQPSPVSDKQTASNQVPAKPPQASVIPVPKEEESMTTT